MTAPIVLITGDNPIGATSSPLIAQWLAGRRSLPASLTRDVAIVIRDQRTVTVREVCDALSLAHTRRNHMSVARVLIASGWTRTRRRVAGRSRCVYIKDCEPMTSRRTVQHNGQKTTVTPTPPGAR
jgi:hypothetical protein